MIMKKMNLFIVAIMLMSTSPLLAQFGVQAGAAFGSAKFSGEDTELGDMDQKFGTRVGFTGGVFYRKQLGESMFAVQPELNWMQKGGKENIDFLGFDVSTDLIVNYLELPVYFLYNGGNSSGFFAGAGPSFNFGMSGKVKVSADGESDEEDLKFGSDEDLKGFHLGINALAGYQLENGINVNAFLSQTLTNSAPDNSGDGKISMFTFGLRVGYMIGAGQEARSAKVKLKQVL
jgi:hypothetical protein